MKPRHSKVTITCSGCGEILTGPDDPKADWSAPHDLHCPANEPPC